MFLDAWAEAVCVIDIVGETVEELLLLINYCSTSAVTYTLDIPKQNATGNNLRFTIGITCSNIQAYELRKMWGNYLTKKNG